MLLAGACASSQIDEIPPAVSLDRAFDLVGRRSLRLEAEERRGTVVLIKDRHSTFPGFQRVRPQLRQVQRDNRLLLEYLVGRGYRLLGCEFPLGPIVENDETATQYRIIRPRLRDRRELDEYGVFQPIRFQLVFRERLEVVGVEDPELLAQDLEDFDLFARARRSLGRRDIPAEDRAEIAVRMRELHLRMAQNIAARGAAAGRNLAALMTEKELDRAVMLVGGAHAPAAAEALVAAGFRVEVFESSRYANENETDSTRPFDDVEDRH